VFADHDPELMGARWAVEREEIRLALHEACRIREVLVDKRLSPAELIDRMPVMFSAEPLWLPEEGRTAVVHQGYCEAHQPVPGFVMNSGVLRLPKGVRDYLDVPEVLTFAVLENDTLLAVPEKVMRRWMEEDERDVGASSPLRSSDVPVDQGDA
jgi:hypothetical protein